MPEDGFEEGFDLILALVVLEHIGDDKKALEEINRSLKAGGHVIVTVLPAPLALVGPGEEGFPPEEIHEEGLGWNDE
jgi:SAM-dependent methyltransferase